MRLKYNSPVVLTYALLCSLILLLNDLLGSESAGNTITDLFTIFPAVHPENQPNPWANPLWYFRMVSHAIGHAHWEHLVGNFTLILLVGPILEEKYGSRDLFVMMFVTALMTGILQLIFFESALLGASGIAFMLILLSSFTNSKAGYVPMTFIVVVALFLGREILNIFENNNISEFTHIIGGVLGAFFGFALEGKQSKNASS